MRHIFKLPGIVYLLCVAFKHGKEDYARLLTSLLHPFLFQLFSFQSELSVNVILSCHLYSHPPLGAEFLLLPSRFIRIAYSSGSQLVGHDPKGVT